MGEPEADGFIVEVCAGGDGGLGSEIGEKGAVFVVDHEADDIAGFGEDEIAAGWIEFADETAETGTVHF